MEQLLTTGYYPYLHLDNPEILIKDSQVYCQPRSLKKKVRKTCGQISEMIARGLSREEIIDQSVELITSELRPSRFGYVCTVIASEFPKTFLKWVKIDELADQVLDVLSACEPVFSLLKISAHSAEQHSVYVTLTNFIRHYLKRKNKHFSSKAKILAQQKKTEIVPATDAGITIKPAEPFKPVLTAQPVAHSTAQQALKTVTVAKALPTIKTVTYFKSELLEKTGMIKALPVSSLRTLQASARENQSEEEETMTNKQYPINKGINKSLVFKGLKAQYIGYMGLGLLIDLLFYAVLYMCKVNTYITLLLTLSLGALITVLVYHLNAQYGEHGLSKSLAKRKTPKIIRSFSRRIFR